MVCPITQGDHENTEQKSQTASYEYVYTVGVCVCMCVCVYVGTEQPGVQWQRHVRVRSL